MNFQIKRAFMEETFPVKEVSEESARWHCILSLMAKM